MDAISSHHRHLGRYLGAGATVLVTALGVTIGSALGPGTWTPSWASAQGTVHSRPSSSVRTPAARPIPPARAQAPAATSAATSAAPAVTPRRSTPCAVTARACVDLATHEAWTTDGAGHVTNGPVSARGGTGHSPTPTGVFSVLYKDEHHYSKEFAAPMPYSVFFYPGDAMHEDNTATSSNGCVHLSWSSARAFYQTLHPGDQVQIVG